jgi:dipeptidyl aminopeptidase/acylaminoacyl peptidase
MMLLRALLLTTTLTLTVSQAFSAPLPVSAYGQLPEVFDVAISPDGTRIALARNNSGGAQAIYVIELATGKMLRAVGVREVNRASEQPKLRGVRFASNQHLAYLMQATFSQTRGVPAGVITPGRSRIDYWRTGLVNTESGKSVLVSLDDKHDWGLAFTGLIAPIDGHPAIGRMAIRSSPFTDGILNVYDINLDRGQARRHRRGTENTQAYAFDAAGNPAARLDINDRKNTWSLVGLDADAEQHVASGQTETGSIGFAGVTHDGRYAFVDTLNDGKRSVLFEHPTMDVDHAVTDPWHNVVVGAGLTVDLPEQHFIDNKLADVLGRLKGQYPDALIQLLTWSMDRSRYIVFIETAADAGGYYLVESGGTGLKLIAMQYPQLKGDALGERAGITYPARDGTRIPAYLTRPTGAENEPKKGLLPTVVLVHGGPVARDTLAFDWWASFLASRGYLVVQPNYRGSGGYGHEWQRAGYGKWGELMQDDVEDSVHALVKAGMADPDRVCIVGASYGGYATLVGATRTPELFACAASFAGVADLQQMLRIEEISGGADSITADWWRMLIGDRKLDREAIDAVSPALRASRVTAPVLLMHGENDTVVPIDQSERMHAALKRARKDVQFIRFPGEDHWLSDAQTRVQMLQELETFLARHIGSESSKQ